MLRYIEDINGSRDRVAGVANEQGNVMGLMPHPEHAVDPLLGAVGGTPILGGLITAAREHAAPLVLQGDRQSLGLAARLASGAAPPAQPVADDRSVERGRAR